MCFRYGWQDDNTYVRVPVGTRVWLQDGSRRVYGTVVEPTAFELGDLDLRDGDRVMVEWEDEEGSRFSENHNELHEA